MNEGFDDPGNNWNMTAMHNRNLRWWAIKRDNTTGKFNVLTDKVAAK